MVQNRAERVSVGAAGHYKSPSRLALLRLTVLMGGAVGMILELVGSRLLAPYFGNGLFVWTALMGVMLGFMSVGNFLGGRLADRRLSISVLFWILASSAAAIAMVSLIEAFVLPALAATGGGRWAAVVSAVILFGVPCTGLGMITPYSTRYALSSLEHSGAVVGSLFALGTLGSILGTFIGGFFLISWVGSHNLVAYLALVPLLLAAAFLRRPFNRKQLVGYLTIAVVVGVSFISSSGAVDSFDSGYDRYFVHDSVDPDSGRPIRLLARDFESAESIIYSDTGEAYVFDYFKYYDLALSAANEVNGSLGRTLLIGGGVFSYPRHQLAGYPNSTTDVVEIDPMLVEVAHERFMLRDDPRMRIYAEDGRMFLNRATSGQERGAGDTPAYDVAILDAFKSANSIPYQLTTIEAMRACYDLLGDKGVLVMNIIADPNGRGARFVSAQYRTIAGVFPQVKLYAVHGLETDVRVQNVSIIAMKSPSEKVDLGALLRKINPGLTAREIDPATLSAEKVLTDDFAPADQLLNRD